MARPASLRPWLLLAGLVLAVHVAGLDWLARQRQAQHLLPLLVPPMYTRLLQPQAPPEPVAAVVAAAAVPRRRQPAAALAVTAPAPPPPVLVQPEPEAPAPSPEPEEPMAQEAMPETQAAIAPPESPLADPLDGWPADTRLTYRLEGLYRGGPLYGEGRVHWQREGSRYQVRLELAVRFFGTVVMTSQGEVTPQDLRPRAYEELWPRQRPVGVRFGEQMLVLDRGRRALRPPGLQDTVSQFVDLAHRFASGRALLAVGGSVNFPMARPAAVDHWTYDVVASELLATPQMGEVQAFHLQPRPLAHPRGDITAEMWFAPSLQYLPVRIKVLLGDGAFVDLVVETIEQR